MSTSTIYQTLDNAQTDSIREQLLQAIEETARSVPKETAQPRLFQVATILIIIAALTAVAYWIMRNDSDDVPPPPVSDTDTPRQPSPEEPTQSQSRQATQEEIDGEDLKRIFALGQAGNVDALLEILKSGQFVSQRIAAPFLGELADPSAIDLLQQAGEHWYPESPDDNPFADAIEQILIRFPDAAPPVVVEEVQPEPKEKPETEKKTEQPPAEIPNITGLVSDFENQPIANAVVELTEIASGRKIGSVNTNPLGQYQFYGVFDRGISLTCRMSTKGTKLITRSLWCGKDSISIANLG